MTTPGPDELSCGSQHCITCGDDGRPMTVLRVDDVRSLALCGDERGERGSVEIALVAPVSAGDRLLVHAGTAIAHLESEVPA
jgi:hydrogenase maturation factor